ncbi:hypothetical protein GCL60_04065 [Silvanigrella paludirubra]|uniref:Uncharacterized protein n=1 Tax=Silvanigrella paludirubra TaxID=2499159 RepID=A0A6N6VXK9_9BACT|nr:hypothetical protein [Silvanigrella paludirubra]KAB8039436.1 hypothetical protein GCL60_04065 [Silvanigrella paludirubra]
MRVKCIINKISEINDIKVKREINLIYGQDQNRLLPFQLNKEYNIYGLSLKDNILRFYICYDDSDNFPQLEFSAFFEIIDYRLSKYWELFIDKDNSHDMIIKEWKDNIYFYNNLLDGASYEARVFNRYKKLIDEEFPNLRVKILNFEEKSNNLYFENQFGSSYGICKNFNNRDFGWFDISIRFLNNLEFEVNTFKSYESNYKMSFDNKRSIFNFSVHEIQETMNGNNYETYLIALFGSNKIKIPFEPIVTDIKVGDFITIKVPIEDVLIEIIEDKI